MQAIKIFNRLSQGNPCLLVPDALPVLARLRTGLKKWIE
jgi:hypothetical protein